MCSMSMVEKFQNKKKILEVKGCRANQDGQSDRR